MKEPSLQKEIGDWNRQENQFRELFSAEALQDKEFQKMKLRAYDRLWHLHKGTAQTTDEKALLIMLRFQRRKMTRKLYPGLLRRVLHKVYARLAANRERKRLQSLAVSQNLDRFTHSSLPGTNNPGKNEQLGPDRALRKPIRQIYGPDLGRKQQSKQNRGLSV